MHSNKLHLLCCCSNSESSIYNTLLTWKDSVDHFHILINNTTDTTADEVRRTGLPVNVHYGEFKDFSQIRNELIEKVVGDRATGVLIFIDDSYELRSPLNDLRRLQLSTFPPLLGISFRVLSRGIMYNKVIGMTTDVRYAGAVHELPVTNCLINLEIPVIDRLYEDHIGRTLSRKSYDLETLSSLVDPRSKFYKVIGTGTLQELLAYQGPSKFKFQTLMKAASMTNVVTEFTRVYVQAAITCPELAAECYFKIYLRTGVKNWLFMAGNKCLNFPAVDVPYRNSYYGKDGLINLQVCKQRMMIELVERSRTCVNLELRPVQNYFF